MYERVPKVVLPMFFFRQTAELTPELGSEVKILLNLAQIGTITFYGFAGIGGLLLAIAAVITIRGNWGDDEDRLSLITTSNENGGKTQDRSGSHPEIPQS